MRRLANALTLLISPVICLQWMLSFCRLASALVPLTSPVTCTQREMSSRSLVSDLKLLQTPANFAQCGLRSSRSTMLLMQQMLGFCLHANSLEVLMPPAARLRRNVEAIILDRDFVDQPRIRCSGWASLPGSIP